MVKFTDPSTDTKDLNRGVAESPTHSNDDVDDDADEQVNSAGNGTSMEAAGHKKRRKNRGTKAREDGRRPIKKRRHSLSKAARDPRDEASPVGLDTGTRSPSPVIDFDGLSKPSETVAPKLLLY